MPADTTDSTAAVAPPGPESTAAVAAPPGAAALRSQHELSAFASMVVASLPFPPLPVMVLQGEDGEDGMASSFDLHQQAVAAQQLGLAPVGRTAEELALSKQQTLARLQEDMAALYAQSERHLSPPVQQAYEIYCNSFRTYLLEHFATCTRDLRFHPLDAVAADSLLVRQGSSHRMASSLLAGEAVCVSSGAHFASYSEMLSAYALELATLAE
jgi:hypothetical protein